MHGRCKMRTLRKFSRTMLGHQHHRCRTIADERTIAHAQTRFYQWVFLRHSIAKLKTQILAQLCIWIEHGIAVVFGGNFGHGSHGVAMALTINLRRARKHRRKRHACFIGMVLITCACQRTGHTCGIVVGHFLHAHHQSHFDAPRLNRIDGRIHSRCARSTGVFKACGRLEAQTCIGL